MIDNPALMIATILWIFFIPNAVKLFYRFVRNNRQFIEKDLRRIPNDPKIIFQITTKSATKTSVVKRGIQSIIESCKSTNYSKYEILIVTEDINDQKTLKSKPCEVLCVDRSFSPNAIKKARALQYAILHRRKLKKQNSDHWIFHMDDESYVVPQTVLSILKFIREKKGIASEGPIFYPLKFEKANRITALAESMRAFGCFECVTHMHNPPPIHMHGSNLLVRSDVEDKIGWEFGPILAEDQRFGYELFKKYGRNSMGWHGGILLEQPPLNIKDHFMQRRRWVIGNLQNIENFSKFFKFRLIYKCTSFFLGFVSGVISLSLAMYINIPKVLSVFSYASFDWNNNIAFDLFVWLDRLTHINSSYNEIFRPLTDIQIFDSTLALILLFSSTVWLLSYQVGLFLNLKYTKIGLFKRIILHIQTLILAPFLGLLESFPAFFSVIEFYFHKLMRHQKIKSYDFYVVEK
ncbi:MAG: glycosyltransferase family 2 protein [Candidatus Nitrosocosmicus sp.]|uniref:glycosyltransferase family 2 protein n=1 Tax=Candidatus Nitrosocosmicus sp. FF01 TaxID=3397670 RepID=UPI0039E8486D